eukprot:TRINITY_DN9108_c0_g4_i1.p1 TRINITY_DN9108_c0_g4~~TRINITY_DN9108_c0_g4_i1.p1  ORF type:complete len:140 (+),score=7.45 TRINITY_DN9108_c0_g4_i1:268-687(+)
MCCVCSLSTTQPSHSYPASLAAGVSFCLGACRVPNSQLAVSFVVLAVGVVCFAVVCFAVVCFAVLVIVVVALASVDVLPWTNNMFPVPWILSYQLVVMNLEITFQRIHRQLFLMILLEMSLCPCVHDENCACSKNTLGG